GIPADRYSRRPCRDIVLNLVYAEAFRWYLRPRAVLRAQYHRPIRIQGKSSSDPERSRGRKYHQHWPNTLELGEPARPIPTWFGRTDRPPCPPPSLEPRIDPSLVR